MNAQSRNRIPVILAWALALAGKAFATQSDVVLPIQGSPSCHAMVHAGGKEILEIKDVHPPHPGDSKTVSGPGEQRIVYTVNERGDGVREWHVIPNGIAIPVNFTVLTAKGSSTVHHFGNPGAYEDDHESAPGEISEVTFCYGLAVPPTPLDKCDDRLCPDGPAVLITLTHRESAWNVESCTCDLPLNRCNPAAPAGAPDGCTNPDAPLQSIPIDITAGADPESWVCFTRGGKRQCYQTRK